jgi:Flp pilus assembly protein TadB
MSSEGLPLARTPFLIAILGALAVWVAATSLTEAPLLSLPVAVGVALVYLQTRASGLVRSIEQERDEVLPLLHAVVPKIRTGVAPELAFISAANEAPSSVARIIAEHCARLRDAVERPGSTPSSGVMAGTVMSILAAVRENGGEISRPFESLAAMIEADQRLRRKQQIATLHVRAQANALIGIALIILVLSLFGGASTLNFLRETQDGRLMVLFAATSMVWGYLLIAILTARISRV